MHFLLPKMGICCGLMHKVQTQYEAILEPGIGFATVQVADPGVQLIDQFHLLSGQDRFQIIQGIQYGLVQIPVHQIIRNMKAA